MPDAAQAGAWRIRGRWHRDHHPAVHIAHLRARYRRRQLRYPLARKPPRQARHPWIDPMTSIDDVMIEITPQVLLKAYACGVISIMTSSMEVMGSIHGCLAWRGGFRANGYRNCRRRYRALR